MKKNNRWPKAIPVLKQNDFYHGEWVVATTEKERKALGICGNRCCMVGWIGHVFTPGDYTPSSISECIGAPGIKFANKINELLGESLGEDRYQDIINPLFLLEEISDGFELLGYDYNSLMFNNKKAVKIWNEALEHFGYTETTFIEVNDPPRIDYDDYE